MKTTTTTTNNLHFVLWWNFLSFLLFIFFKKFSTGWLNWIFFTIQFFKNNKNNNQKKKKTFVKKIRVYMQHLNLEKKHFFEKTQCGVNIKGNIQKKNFFFLLIKLMWIFCFFFNFSHNQNLINKKKILFSGSSFVCFFCLFVYLAFSGYWLKHPLKHCFKNMN